MTTSLKHSIAKAFRAKLEEMLGNTGESRSFTLTFLITGDPQTFTPKADDFKALMEMARKGKSFDNVCVQVVQVPKTLNSLS